MTADAEAIIYTDGTSEMVCKYLFMRHIVIDEFNIKRPWTPVLKLGQLHVCETTV